MPNARLTQRMVDNGKASTRDLFWWDTDLSGFGLKITPRGSKVYLVQYRMGGRASKTRRFTIGKHGSPWTATTAREEARRLLRMVATGLDPQTADQARQRDAATLEFAAYAEKFLEAYGRKSWRERTFETRASDLRRWAVPILRNTPLPAVSRRDITAVLDSLPDENPSLPRNVYVVTRRLFSWAVERGEIQRSPFEGMKSPRAMPSRDRVLDDEELALIAALAPYLGRPFSQFMELLLLTGQRRAEVAKMSWTELDRRKREWILPSDRSKNGQSHTVPLGEIAIVVLDDLADGVSWPRKGFVFTTNGHSPVAGFSKMKKRLDNLLRIARPEREIAPWRLHDLRRTMATNLQRLGVRFEVTEALLNHIGISRSGVAGVYQRHDWKIEKVAAVDAWNDRLRQFGRELATDLDNEAVRKHKRPRSST